MAAKLFFLKSGRDRIDRIRTGDQQALLELFDQNRRPIVTLVTRNGGSVDDAEDVLQEAIVILWEKIRDGSFEERAALGTYLYGVARRLWLRRLSKKTREPAKELEPDMIPSGDPDPEDLFVEDEKAGGVVKALDQLDRVCKSLLVLFYYEGMSMVDIAGMLGFANAATAKAKKYQCKERLRQLMQRMSDE